MNRSHRRGNGIVAIALAGALALPLAATARPPGGHARGLESRIEQLDLDA